MMLTLMLMLMTQQHQRQRVSQQQQHQLPLGPGGTGLTALRKKLRSQQQHLVNSQQQQSGLGQWKGPQQQRIGLEIQLIGPQPRLTSPLHPQRTLLQLHQLLSLPVMPLTHPLSAL
jgi:hypothetical protein